jgi:long-subunit acyl-CoA synthetase (AMP-forming)
MAGTEIRIADDGEILIRGPHIFSGYYKNTEASNEVIKNGWLYTGDIGTLDADNFLTITDRKKDILITAGGKNISPQNLENMLKHLPYVQAAVVVGNNKKYLCALLAPDKEALTKKARPDILDEIKKELALINNKLAPVEQIKKIALLEEEFSIESGEITPTLKIKRKFINEKYAHEIQELYEEQQSAV